MTIRPTQASTFALVQQGLLDNYGKLVDAQAQASSGKRIQQPSDDPVGSAQALNLRARVGGIERFLDAIGGGTRELDTAASVLQDAGGLVAEARAVAVEALNGIVNAGDRRVLAGKLREIKDQLLELGNSRVGGRYLFAGTQLDAAPFRASDVHGTTRVAYVGNADQQELLVGNDLRLAIGIPGSEIFAGNEFAGVVFEGLTGAALGTTANQGSGAVTLFMRHETSTLTLGAGVTLAAGGANDNVIGTHAIAIDPVAGTATLGAGPARALPAVGSPEYSDFALTNAQGDEVHLDFTTWTGAATAGTVVGTGSMSLDGTAWTAIDNVSTDVELIDAATNTVLHVDVTGIHRAEDELVSFTGNVNVFDALETIADALENAAGLTTAEQDARVRLVFDELDRNHDNVVAGLSTLGARSGRLKDLEEGYGTVGLELQTQVSRIEDADYSQVVLDMMRAEQTLQITQSIGSRLLQTSLLNFLR
jgi:flagellin-like hook-associated protein FlgL